ncbi:helix-turn-helix domain-containing protein [Flavobacterium psychrotrophum]|uniref:helix-turn-helix domain-containing protein n=1 Tax=Flavobacterium psychrotrophum TaxID=2294119 RepID=UPI0013C41667|nr:helix-turn-helix transcriptional regulator [Flavobacterium psychrotrophum]
MLQFKDKRLVKFGTYIASLRKERGLESKDVTKNCSLSTKDLQSIEDGSKNFGFTTLLELAKGIGISPKDLLNIDLD